MERRAHEEPKVSGGEKVAASALAGVKKPGVTGSDQGKDAPDISLGGERSYKYAC